MSTKKDIIAGAVIVAAGLSSRMNAFKPMLPLAGSTVIRTLIGTLRSGGVGPIVVVTGRNGEELAEHIADLDIQTVHNEKFATTDMFRSACLGFQALAGQSELIFFTPGDVPLFSPYSIGEMLEQMTEFSLDILTPTYNGHRGHPVLLSAAAADTLSAYRGPGGLRGAISNYEGKKELLGLPDRGLLLDADTPEDYARLLEYARNRQKAAVISGEAQVSISIGGEVFDEQLALLLEQTDKCGSLADACRQAGTSYSSGWKKVKSVEEALGFLLIRSSRGGASGGRSHLTPKGKELLATYKKYRGGILRCQKKQFAKYFGEEKQPPGNKLL